ncbi:hypothetical protein [Streptomyces chartreusis]|uniref:hypothetical protein n=1 Tax=Streptomyces chartreusis TaxID=1969 RepID=UPI0036BF54E4
MKLSSKTIRTALIGSAAAALFGGVAPAAFAEIGPSYSRPDRVQGPEVYLTAPIPGDALAPGRGVPGAGSADKGAGFLITVEAVTHGKSEVAVNEGLDIRHTDRLGGINPDFPGLVVTADNDLTKPDGGIIPAGTNLAPLFNVAGTDDTPGRGETVWASWHVLESLKPGTKSLTLTSSVTDLNGHTGTTKQKYRVSTVAGKSGQELTPAPASYPAANDRYSRYHMGRGPGVAFSAPENPTAVSTGTLPQPTLKNGSLFFIGLDLIDRYRHGIAVNENADGKGQIVDGTQIAAKGPNRNIPGLEFTFDVDLRQPNGNLVPAGQNLAPLFNTAGSSIGRDGAVHTSLGWTVGGAIPVPNGKDTMTMTAKVTDNKGATTITHQTVDISSAISGQDLTPAP